MNEPCTRFQTNLSRVAKNSSSWDRLVNDSSDCRITRHDREKRQVEALFAEALGLVERARASSSQSVLLDWEDFENNSPLNLSLARARSVYCVKILASAIASYQSICSDRLQRQVRSVIARLTQNPFLSHSIKLPIEEEKLNWQARKIQLDSWGILYAVDEGRRQAIVIEITARENDYFSIASLENIVFSDRSNLLGHLTYHYC
ncbi:hypothetical protein [Oscillatoria sp. FACHB-1406]|uniref:hypothetical protein n=1 Tax=Oscillatoria sp. FACHB-1406 TaxID=2692846 RepID=UPI001684E704|nr:hypothetical protein [Oscillatoria sp. FACHB-1406]MBD2577367.1 hypothetical protein [Oscillatoria sp. FACHB-1406]